MELMNPKKLAPKLLEVIRYQAWFLGIVIRRIVQRKLPKKYYPVILYQNDSSKCQKNLVKKNLAASFLGT